MPYSEFTLNHLKKNFNLHVQEDDKLFANVAPVAPSGLLREFLDYNIPLALKIDTEKARSEMIVVPILLEMRKHFKDEVSLFSGNDFNVDKEKGLSGKCDFIISQSPEQLEIEAPVAVMFEAKDDNIKSGIPQCIAAMIAAQIFNEQNNNTISCIYGVVTTGTNWKFMKLTENTVFIDAEEHFIGSLELILGILAEIIQTTRPNNLAA